MALHWPDFCLITIHYYVLRCCCFSDIDISQGSIATRLTYGEIFRNSFIRYGVVGLTVIVSCTLSEIWKVIGQIIDLLVRAKIRRVRRLLEYDSVVWSPSLKRDVALIEQVQKRFTKRRRGYRDLRYVERLKRLNRRGGVQGVLDSGPCTSRRQDDL